MSVPGQGDNALTEGLDDRNQRKSTLALMRRAVRAGWPIENVDRKAIIERMESIARHCDDERAAASATKVLLEMRASDIKAIEALDKMERLEAGEATEILQFPTLDPKAR